MWQWLPELLFFLLQHLKVIARSEMWHHKNDLMRFLSVFNDSLQNSLSLCAVSFLFQSFHSQLVLWNMLGTFFPTKPHRKKRFAGQTLSFVEFSASLFLLSYSCKGKQLTAIVRSVCSAHKGLIASWLSPCWISSERLTEAKRSVHVFIFIDATCKSMKCTEVQICSVR